MQVNMLNLLRVILFQSNFLDKTREREYQHVFMSPLLIDSLVNGMKNEESFVRMHFI